MAARGETMLVFQNYGWKQSVQDEPKKKGPSPIPYKTGGEEILGYNPVAMADWKVAWWMGPNYGLLGIGTKSDAAVYCNTRFYYNPDANGISASVKDPEWAVNATQNKQLSDLKVEDVLTLGLNAAAVTAKQFTIPVSGAYLDLAHTWKEKTTLNADDAQGGIIDGGDFIVRLRAGDPNSPPVVLVMDKNSGQETYNSSNDKKFTNNYVSGEIGFYDKGGLPLKLWITNLTPGANGADQKADIAIVNHTWHLTHNAAVEHNGSTEKGTIVKFNESGDTYSRASKKFRVIQGGEFDLAENGSFAAPSLFLGQIYNDGALQRVGEPINITSSGQKIRFQSDAGDISVVNNGNSSGQYEYIDYDTKTNMYVYPNGTSVKLDALGTLKLQVKNNMVSGNGALLSVDASANAVVITENTRTNAVQSDYVSTYLPYTLSGARPNFGDVEYKGRGQTDPVTYNGQGISENTTQVKVGGPYSVSVDLSTDPDKSKITLEYKGTKMGEYEKPTGVREYARAPQKRTENPSFSHYQEVRIPVSIQDPDAASVRLYTVPDMKEVHGVYVSKEEEGLRIGGGALMPGNYSYVVSGRGQQPSRGIFNVQP